VPPCTHCAKQLLNTGMLILVIPKDLELDPVVANMFKRNALRTITVIGV
jgi:deoxycytidylate deaminase